MHAGTVGIILGSIQIAPLIRQLDQPDLERALLMFVGIASEVDDVPFGSARDLWDRDALAVKDRRLAEYERRLKKHDALGDCRAAEALLIADLIGSGSQ